MTDLDRGPANVHDPKDVEAFARFKPKERGIVLINAAVNVLNARRRQALGEEPVVHEIVDAPTHLPDKIPSQLPEA